MRVAKALLSVGLALVAVAVAAPAAGAAVVLNEVNCEGTDWIELVNTGATPADVSGWLLTDDPLDAAPPRDTHRFTLPAGSIQASGSMIFEKGASGFPFGISCGDDTIRLADAASAPVDDEAVPALTAPTDTWGRFPNGTGSWTQTTPTKGTPNEPSSAAGGGPSDAAAWLFDPHAVVEIDLELPQASIDALALDPEEYQDGTFSLRTTGGVYGPLAVGVRLKGSIGSFRPLTGKAAFKVKFNHSVSGQRLLGLKKLTLNNMVQDPSMVHEVLAYRAFRAMDVPAPRTGYAFVRVNGAAYGVYLNVESLDDVALPRMLPSTMHLYEGVYGADVAPGGAAAFEVDEGSESDRTDLEQLIAAANANSEDWSRRVGAIADLDEMTRMWATENYVGHWDGYAGRIYTPNNYYLHSDGTGRFSMLPWGTDQTWSHRVPFDGDAGQLFDSCLDDSGCAQTYRQAVVEVKERVAALALGSEAQSLASMLAPWQAMDPRKSSTAEDIAAGMTGLRDFLAVRPGDAAAWLSATAPPGNPPLPKLQLPARSASPVVEPARMAVLRTKTSARGLTVRLMVPGAGMVRLRGTAWVAGARRTVCAARARRVTAGELTLRCRLSRVARRRLRSRALRVSLRTSLAPALGPRTTASHKVKVPRLRRPSG